MTNTPREKVLTLLLPSCMVLLIYAWMAQDKKQPGLVQLEQGLAAAKSQAVPPALVAAKRTELAAVQKELADLERLKKGLTDDWQAAAVLCTKATTRPERADRLNALLNRNRLTLIDSRLAESGKDIRLSPALDRLAKLLAERAGGQLPQVWRYSVQGRYADVLRTLEELGREEALAIPIGLTMKEADPEISGREWTLLVWI